MANKTKVSFDSCCSKCRKMALHSVTKIDGVDSLSLDMKQKTVTVFGDADPVDVANTLRKKCRGAKLVSVGPVPPLPRKEDDKKGKEEKPKEAKIEETKEVPKGVLEKVRFAAMSPQPMSYTVCEGQCYPPCPDC